MFKNILYIFTAVFISCFFMVSQAFARDYGDDYTSEREDETVLDYDKPRSEVDDGKWKSFGCKWVSYDEDRVVFRVRRAAGFFQKIRIKVGNDKAYFINARVVSYDGFRKKFHIASDESFPGQAVSVQFSNIPRRIKKIILKYDARMRPGDQTKICLSGKKARQQPPVVARRPRATDMSWKDLGCIKSKKSFNDDYIRVGSLKGYFKALRFTVHRSPAMIEDLSVTFEGGRKERIRVKGYISAGKTSKAYFFRQGGKLSVIDITSRSRSLFRSSRICFQGLTNANQSYGREAARQRGRKEPYQNIPRSEEELLDDEQYLSKNIPPKNQEGSRLDDYINSFESEKKEARKREALKRAQQQKRKQARKKQLALAEKKRAEARRQLERRAASQHKQQQQQKQQQDQSIKQQGRPPALSDKKTGEEQAKEDDEAFRKEQEKADKMQAELERQNKQQRATKEKADQARIDAEKQAKKLARQQEESANKQAEAQADRERELAREAQILAQKNAAQAEAQAELQRLEAQRQQEKKVEEERLAEIQKLAAKRLAEKQKIHSKKAEFPTSKISPDQTGWINYGCQNFGNKIEERYIPVGRMQGTFTKIRVRVSGNSLTLKKMYVVYGNGKSEPLIRYSSRVKIGAKTSDYTLSHRRRFISEVKLKAKARDRSNDKKSLVCLEAYR